VRSRQNRSALVPHSLQPTVIAIGASAGGIDQIRVMLDLLPDDLHGIVLVAVHRPIIRVSYLCEMLAQRSRMPVVEAFQDEHLLPGRCYLGLPAAHLGLGARDRAVLTADPEGRLRRRTVDDLFFSVASHAGPRAIGVVLSGMLRDGAAGLAAIKTAGGRAMAQLPAAAACPGMPQAAIDEGTAMDLVATTAGLAGMIAGLTEHGGGCRPGTGSKGQTSCRLS
jgi:chemotaxis response regulator CheB